MINGFADRRLCPLGYARPGFKIKDSGFKISILNSKSWIFNLFGEDDGIRTRNFQLEGLAA